MAQSARCRCGAYILGVLFIIPSGAAPGVAGGAAAGKKDADQLSERRMPGSLAEVVNRAQRAEGDRSLSGSLRIFGGRAERVRADGAGGSEHRGFVAVCFSNSAATASPPGVHSWISSLLLHRRCGARICRSAKAL